jgi:hypothetical protein
MRMSAWNNDHDVHTVAAAFVVTFIVRLVTVLLTVHYAPALLR